jgi:hypothetical protein
MPLHPRCSRSSPQISPAALQHAFWAQHTARVWWPLDRGVSCITFVFLAIMLARWPHWSLAALYALLYAPLYALKARPRPPPCPNQRCVGVHTAQPRRRAARRPAPERHRPRAARRRTTCC